MSPRDFEFGDLLAQRVRHMSGSVIREMLKITQQPDIISFAGGMPAPELFPLDDVRRATETVLNKYGSAALQYSTTEGHPPLREWAAGRAGIPAANVQIVTGSQQGLDLLGKVLINEGDTVVVEAPTYLGALQCFFPYQPRYEQVEMDDDGLDVDALESLLKQLPPEHHPKLLYTIPNFQNPTGSTMSLERRRRLVEVTAQHGVMIVEDDPYGPLRFTGEPLPNLYDLGLELWGDPDKNHVIYCSSFSKTLFPGLRQAWIQAPAPLIAKLVQAKQGADLHTPTLNQMIITELLPILPRQIDVVVKAYGERAAHMVRRIEEHFPAGASATRPKGGMFLWVRLPGGIDTAKLLPQAVKRKVAFVPGSPFYATGGGENTMRLSFSCATEAEIDRGIAALAETVLEGLD